MRRIRRTACGARSAVGRACQASSWRVTVTGHVSPDTRGRAGSLHTSWSVLVVLAMTYRGCLQQQVDVSEDTEVQRLEGGVQTSRDETESNRSSEASAIAGILSIGTPTAQDGQTTATAAEPGAVRAALAGSTPQSGAVQMLVAGVRMEPGTEGRLPPATIVEDTGAALQHGTPYENTETGAFVRTEKKRGRNDLLKTKWFCGYCRKYTPRAEDRCRECKTSKADVAGHEEAAVKRLKSRESTRKGRQQNRSGAGAAESVEREAVATFHGPEHDAAVEREVAALSAAVGDPVSNSAEESKLGIVEGFLLLHYKGEHSVQPDESGKATHAQGITGHVVANFFNTIGRLAKNGERSFPFGGYYNAFKEDGVTAGLLKELREIVRTQLCGGRHNGRLHCDDITRNCQTFKTWYTSSSGRASACYKMLRTVIVRDLQKWCAAQYQPLGRLCYGREHGGRAAPSWSDFRA